MKRKKTSKLAKGKADVTSRYWRTKADRAWAVLVKQRAHGKCEVCRTNQNLQSHHLFDRSRKDMRHELRNGICLCAKHHKWNREISAHRGSVAFYSWFVREHREWWAWLLSNLYAPKDYEIDYKAAFERLSE